jgi:hypothetical protein
MDSNPWDEAPAYGDTHQMDVYSSTKLNFGHAMRIAFSNHREAEYYKKDSKAGLVLFWTEPHGLDGVYPLPNKMNVEAAIEFCWQWLCSLDGKSVEDYTGRPPSIDGSVLLGGFRVYNEEWGHVLGQHAAIVAVRPEYILLGK